MTAPKSARRRLHQRGAGGVETSSSSATDSHVQTVIRRASSRKMRSSSSDAATITDVEEQPRPVSPRRISDPICQHSDSQVDFVEGPATSIPPTVAPPSVRVPPRPIVTTAQLHPAPRQTTAGIESLSSSARSPCLPAELYLATEIEGVVTSRRHYWRIPSSTPTARREHNDELQQQQQQHQRCGTALSLGSLHHQRLLSSVATLSQPPAALGPRPAPVPGDHYSCRGVVPVYRRLAACRSETTSPVIDIDDDDDDDDGVNLTSSSACERPIHTSWQVRRHLKAISERSQSSDTIYV